MRRPVKVAIGASCVLLLLGLGVPQLLSAIQRSMFKRGYGDMRVIGNALERYRAAHGSYPVFPTRTPVLHLEPYLVPEYISSLPRTDNWQHPFLVVSSSSHYEIWSLGADGREGPNSADGPTHTWNDDTVLRDGRFVRYSAYLAP